MSRRWPISALLLTSTLLIVALAGPAQARRSPAKGQTRAKRAVAAKGCTLRRVTPRLRRLCRALQELSTTDPSSFAVGFHDLRDDQRLFIRPDVWMHAASTYKTAVMVAVFDDIRRGKLGLATQVPITNRFRSIVDGSPYRLPVPKRPRDLPPRMIGKSLPVSTLLEEMITISSNLATNLLLERVGAKRAMKTLRRLKLRGIKVLRGVQDLEAFDRGLSNEVTARGMTRLYVGLAKGKLVSKKASRKMVEILLRQRLHAKLPRLLPRSVKLAHKGGTISTVAHDGGIAYRKGRAEYVVVVMSRGYRSRRKVEKVLGRFSRAIWLHVAAKRGWKRGRRQKRGPRARIKR